MSAEPRQVIHLDKLSDSPMLNNRVLVKIDVVPEDGYKLKSGVIIGGSDWNEGARVARYGTVVKVPKRLIWRKQKAFDATMEWLTDIEIQEGDVVFFGKIISANAPAIRVGEDLYYLIPYGELIMRVRNKEIYPLNGYAIVEKVTEKMRRNGLVLDFGDFHNKRVGVVRYVGMKNAAYYGTDAVDADVEVGDKVVFEGSFWTELEQQEVATLDEDLGFVQRCWIIGKL